MRNWLRGRLRPASGLVLLVLAVLPGCGADELASPTAARLKGLATVYLDYAVPKNGKGPANEQVLRKHMRSLPDFVLRTNGVDPEALDALFVSERDGEPFVVLYGISISGMSGTKAPLLAHEKTGKGGKRLIVFANTKVELVDDARLQELMQANQ
jgi:hypothetical protein